MTTRDDLNLLEDFNKVTPEHRLRSFIASRLFGDDHDQRVEALAEVCGYARPGVVKLWISMKAAVPVRVLPKLSEALSVDLAVLTAMWLSGYCAADDPTGEIAFSITPQYTSDELNLIETAREIYAEERLIDDLRSGALEE